jgi:hypothetical protein
MMPGSSTKPERGEYQRNQEERGTQQKRQGKANKTRGRNDRQTRCKTLRG